MGFSIWTNHVFRPAAGAALATRLDSAGHRLVVSPQASAVVLAAASEDATLAEADVAFGQPDPAQVLRCPRLRWVALSSAGYTRYAGADFLGALRARGVRLTNASQVFADPCAQHVLAQMLALERNLPAQLRNQDGARAWQYLEARFASGVLTGKRVVILGFGAIGQRLTDLLRPFDCDVTAMRRSPRPAPGLRVVAEDAIAGPLAEADHVVNALPDSPETTRWVSAARFAQMKPGARFYNIGRGTTVDQPALIAALASGHLGGAYLDVMDPEPLPPDHPLWGARNCHITCHIGGGSAAQDDNLATHFRTNLERFERGGPLVDAIL